jgi:dTDP-4-dehydrorhamnose reductase
MSRILITGKNGQVGWELQRTLATLGEVVALDRNGMDLANPDSIRSTIRHTKPNIIVNAAAYTAVDKAESEPNLAMAINGTAPGIISEEARRLGAAVIHYSTDYVFDGKKEEPYSENDIPNPLNVYGKTKLAGEQAIQAVGVPYLIFRTSWVYGTRGRNFLLTILRLAKERDELRIVADQIGAPTWSRTIAEATAQVLAKLHISGEGAVQGCTNVAGDRKSGATWGEGASSVYNLSASGSTSWHGFASLIVKLLSDGGQGAMLRAKTIIPIATEDYPLPASRPKNSRLDNTRLMIRFGLAMPGWDRCAVLCLEEIGKLMGTIA